MMPLRTEYAADYRNSTSDEGHPEPGRQPVRIALLYGEGHHPDTRKQGPRTNHYVEIARRSRFNRSDAACRYFLMRLTIQHVEDRRVGGKHEAVPDSRMSIGKVDGHTLALDHPVQCGIGGR